MALYVISWPDRVSMLLDVPEGPEPAARVLARAREVDPEIGADELAAVVAFPAGVFAADLEWREPADAFDDGAGVLVVDPTVADVLAAVEGENEVTLGEHGAAGCASRVLTEEGELRCAGAAGHAGSHWCEVDGLRSEWDGGP